MAEGSRIGAKGEKKPAVGFWKPLKPSVELAHIVGKEPLPRTEAVRRIWIYIRREGLQDPDDKRTIRADRRLKAVFYGKASVSMFELSKLVNSHLQGGSGTLPDD